jgi:hypothetical protein
MIFKDCQNWPVYCDKNIIAINVLEAMIMKLYAITSLSQSKTFFMMKVGAETQAGGSYTSSPQKHLFSEGPATFGRSLKEGEN